MANKQVELAIAEIRAQLGVKTVVTVADDIAPWLTDWRGRYSGVTSAMLAPATVEEVAEIVAIAARHRVPLVPQGGNTGMVGGATPPADGSSLLVSLRRMNRIRTIDPAANIAVVEAGVVLSTLHDAAAAQGSRFPLSLAAKGSATVGGLVSTNAGGTQVLRFGSMRALVLGIEAVMPPNTTGPGGLWCGLDALKKDNRGYDLNQLLIGSEGTLGVVTAVALKLVPAAGDRAVAWLGVASPDDALRLLRRMERASGDAIESFEIMPADSLALVLRHVPGTRAPLGGNYAWHLLVELVAAADASAQLEALVADGHEAGLVADAAIAASEAQANAFWHLRESISEGERAAGPAVQHDISVPVDAMPRFMIEAARTIEEEFPGTIASAFGHLGDGNVHFHVRAPLTVDAERWREGEGKAASRRVHDLVGAAGGSISAEHGIGQMKRDELARLSDPVRMSVLRAIKAAIDPLGLMNPGKLL